jgi:hypothetical protein
MYAFAGWRPRRKYTKTEKDDAEIFHLVITAAFEPTGEECGTEYDDHDCCSYCGAGRQQVSELKLNLRRVPKNKDIARTIADEWIVSERFTALCRERRVSGVEFPPV